MIKAFLVFVFMGAAMAPLIACSGNGDNASSTDSLSTNELTADNEGPFEEVRLGDWNMMLRIDNSEYAAKGCSKFVTPDTVYEIMVDNELAASISFVTEENIESIKNRVLESTKKYPSSRYSYIYLLDTQKKFTEAAEYAESFNDLYRFGMVAATLRALDEAIAAPDNIEAIAMRLEKDLDNARPRSRKYAMEMDSQIMLMIEALKLYAHSEAKNAMSNAELLFNAMSNGATTEEGPLRTWLAKQKSQITDKEFNYEDAVELEEDSVIDYDN